MAAELRDDIGSGKVGLAERQIIQRRSESRERQPHPSRVPPTRASPASSLCSGTTRAVSCVRFDGMSKSSTWKRIPWCQGAMSIDRRILP
jgi:hypothetical protein